MQGRGRWVDGPERPRVAVGMARGEPSAQVRLVSPALPALRLP